MAKPCASDGVGEALWSRARLLHHPRSWPWYLCPPGDATVHHTGRALGGDQTVIKLPTLAVQVYTIRDFIKTPRACAASMANVRAIGYPAVQLDLEHHPD